MGDKGVAVPGNGRRLQIQKERKDAFSVEKKQLFLDHLAGCCNVNSAAEAAGGGGHHDGDSPSPDRSGVRAGVHRGAGDWL